MRHLAVALLAGLGAAGAVLISPAQADCGGGQFAPSHDLALYIKESPADVQAVNLLRLYPLPLKVLTHDHVDLVG